MFLVMTNVVRWNFVTEQEKYKPKPKVLKKKKNDLIYNLL